MQPWRLPRLQSFAAQACFGRRKKVGSERENKIGFINSVQAAALFGWRVLCAWAGTPARSAHW
jgi:hypothetical protein